MENIFEWLSTNKSWLFEGLGVVIIMGIIRFFWKKQSSDNDNNSVSNKAKGKDIYQAGRDINLTKKEEKKTNSA